MRQIKNMPAKDIKCGDRVAGGGYVQMVKHPSGGVHVHYQGGNEEHFDTDDRVTVTRR